MLESKLITNAKGIITSMSFSVAPIFIDQWLKLSNLKAQNPFEICSCAAFFCNQKIIETKKKEKNKI